jgi:hypothetical protein
MNLTIERSGHALTMPLGHILSRPRGKNRDVLYIACAIFCAFGNRQLNVIDAGYRHVTILAGRIGAGALELRKSAHI